MKTYFLYTPIVTINYKTSHANGTVAVCFSNKCKLFQTQHIVLNQRNLKQRRLLCNKKISRTFISYQNTNFFRSTIKKINFNLRKKELSVILFTKAIVTSADRLLCFVPCLQEVQAPPHYNHRFKSASLVIMLND